MGDSTPQTSQERKIPFSLTTFNVHGIREWSWEFLRSMMMNYDILLLQETWLRPSQEHLFADKMPDIDFVAVSAMDADSLGSAGRPHGGCAIIWKSSMCCTVVPVTTNSKRICCVKLILDADVTFLIINVYMPCDAPVNFAEFQDALDEVARLCINADANFIICAGDFNTDFRRSSQHTRALVQFLEQEELSAMHGMPLYSVQYTFESKANFSRSIIDHVFVSHNLAPSVQSIGCVYSPDNMSDHAPLFINIEMNIETHDRLAIMQAKLLWAKASNQRIEQYKHDLNEKLNVIRTAYNVLECNDLKCESAIHKSELQLYHDEIVDACLEADGCIPRNTNRTKSIPGWNQFVRPLREKSLFWHGLWVTNDRPQHGVVADIMRYTRKKYHKAIKQVKRTEVSLRYANMAENFDSGRNQFWTEVKKMRGKGCTLPSNVAGIVGDEAIAELFKDKYDELYNSVGFSEDDARSNWDQISQLTDTHTVTCNSHSISTDDVDRAIRRMKRNKHDGARGLYSDHLKNSPESLWVHLSHLFNGCLLHGFSPTEFSLSVMQPIPKSARKSKSDPNNYRSIALSSILNKAMDTIIIRKCQVNLSTSDYQFGFKENHSTVQCSFVVNEVTKYYNSRETTVYAALLDASKAFDRVSYDKLFSLLLEHSLCPLVARFLLSSYMNQKAHVRWGTSTSRTFSMKNGVKQGGVLSPLLFTLYYDVLLHRLIHLGLGCRIGSSYAGAFAYADDVLLLSPSVAALKDMLDVCSDYADEYSMSFNASKSRIVVIPYGRPGTRVSITFAGEAVEQVDSEKHLGILYGQNVQTDIVKQLCSEMICKTNMLKCHFDQLPLIPLYNLFKTYSMPLYGSQILDLSHTSMSSLSVTWRKCLRHLFDLPRRTHCNLIPLIFGDRTLEDQISIRICRFLSQALNSSNKILKQCAILALNGSESNLSNSITHISFKTGTSRFDFNKMTEILLSFPDTPDETERRVDFIRDILGLRHALRSPHRIGESDIGIDELNIFLEVLCCDI